MAQHWNGIAENCNDRFRYYLAEYSKVSRIAFAWFSFHVGLLFYAAFRLSNRTPKIARILTLYQANAATLTPLSKEDKILIRSLQECKVYIARQFITEFMNKGWTNNSINRLLVKFRTVDRRLGNGRRILRKTSTQLSRCCWVRKTNLRAKRNFAWGGGSIDHQFHRLFTKICISSAARKGALNSWLKRTACTRYVWHAVWESVTW